MVVIYALVVACVGTRCKRSMRSKKFNEARMEKMKMRDEVVMKCKNTAAERLVSEVSAHKNYPKLLEALIVQVCFPLHKGGNHGGHSCFVCPHADGMRHVWMTSIAGSGMAIRSSEVRS